MPDVDQAPVNGDHAPGGEPSAAAPAAEQAASTGPRRGHAFPKGRVRDPEEVARASAARSLLARARRDPAIIRPQALQALEKSGGRGPEMIEAFGAAVKKTHRLEPGSLSLRNLLSVLVDVGDLQLRRVGNTLHYAAGGTAPAAHSESGTAAAQSEAPAVARASVATPAAVALPRTPVAVLPELEAMAAAYETLAPLNASERGRALAWLHARLLPDNARPSKLAPEAVGASPPPSTATRTSRPPVEPSTRGRPAAEDSFSAPGAATKNITSLLRTARPSSERDRVIVLAHAAHEHLSARAFAPGDLRRLATAVGADALPNIYVLAPRLEKEGLFSRGSAGYALTAAGRKYAAGMPHAGKGARPAAGRKRGAKR